MATMRVTRTLRSEPNGASIKVGAEEDELVEVIEKRDGFTKIRLITKPDSPEGWVSSDAVNEQGAPTGQPIDKKHFAQSCWHGALIFGVNAHYMMAVAEYRSRVRTDRDGARIGPFRLTQAEWDAHREDAEFGFDFPAERIHEWRMQCPVFALMAFRTLNKFVEDKKKRPTVVELYQAQFGSASEPPLPAENELIKELDKALHSTGLFILQAGGEVLADALAALTPTAAGTAKINFASPKIPSGREDTAKLIVNRFEKAGFGPLQQVAALANAIAESSLDPTARNFRPPNEDSVGLFQLNRLRGGLGKNNTPEELMVPENNIGIIIKEVSKFDAFRNATSLHDAVKIFVEEIEKPADKVGAIRKRSQIAETLLVA